MKVLFQFQGKKSFQKSLGIALLCIVLSAPAYSQSQEQGGPDNHKFLYGIHLGFTDNQFDLYSTNGGLSWGTQGRWESCQPGRNVTHRRQSLPRTRFPPRRDRRSSVGTLFQPAGDAGRVALQSLAFGERPRRVAPRCQVPPLPLGQN